MYHDTVLDKECTQEDTTHYCASSDRFEAEVNDIRQHVFELEDEIKTTKKALENAHGPSHSDVRQKSATKVRAPLILLTTKPASSAQPRIADSGKGKNKAHPSPEPYVEDVTMDTPSKFNVAAAYEWHVL